MTTVLPGFLLPTELRDVLGVPFTDEQLAAATAPLGPGVIVAGAGSGKTSVMAARVVWLVATQQVEPARVLGLTFTNKAAAELAARIRTALDRAGVTGDGEPVVSTYHAYAGRLVGEHALRLGVEPQSRLLADASRFQLAGRVLRRHRGPVEALTRPLSMLIGDLVGLEAEMSEHLVGTAELIAFDVAWEAALAAELAAVPAGRGAAGRTKELLGLVETARERRELAGLVAEYRAAKRDLDAVDFGDQVTFAARLAEQHPEVGRLERERAGVVLLDEYQDTSVAQRRMLAGLFASGHPVTAVGDPCQAIYGWRGASVANLDGFPAHFPTAAGTPAPAYELSVNQRSGGRLLELANDVASILRARHRVTLLRPRPDVAKLGRTEVALHPSWADEVTWVAARLRAAVDGGVPPGECAVLVRARADVPALYAGLVAAGLPVEVVGLGGLLTLPEVADVVAALEVLDDPTANASLLRLLTGPRLRIGARDLAALGRRAQEVLRTDAAGRRALLAAGAAGSTPAPLEDAVAGVDPCDVPSLADVLDRAGAEVGEQARVRLAAFAAELRGLRRHLDEPLLDLVHRIVEVSGLAVELSASPAALAAGRRDSLAAFLDVAADFADLDGESSVASFLAFLRAAQQHDRGLDSTTPSGADAVQLMTVHKAKGLEWSVVAVPDLTKGVFPVNVVKGRWTTTAATLPAPLRGDADDQPGCTGWGKAELAAFKEAGDAHLAREEQRLGYVAVTRAKSLLIGSGHWWGPTQKKARGPSSLLEQLREHASSSAGAGTVVEWAPPPVEQENPFLAPPAETAWPPPYEPAAHALRLEAAQLVVDELRRIAPALAPPAPAHDDGAGRDGDTPGSAPDGAAGGAGDGDADAGLSRREREMFAALDRDAALLLEEAARERRTDRAVPLPRSLTTSQLVRLREDPDGLARDLARPLPRRPVPQARRGTRFHAWVEQLSSLRPLLDPADLPGAEDEGIGDDAELEALQEAFLASPYGRRTPHAVEAPFEITLGGRAVRGRIDAVYELPDGRWEVVDWKTGTEPADPVQLAVYRLAWARLVGADPGDVDAAFLYVRSGEITRPDLPDEQALAALLAGATPVP